MRRGERNRKAQVEDKTQVFISLKVVSIPITFYAFNFPDHLPASAFN